MSKKKITFDFATIKELYRAYMPFIINGGIFIPTKESFYIGEEVELDLRLIKDPERLTSNGVVVWLTPVGAQGGKPAGIGVQLDTGNEGLLWNRIETHLAEKLNSSEQTDTM